MHFMGKFAAFSLFLIWNLGSSGTLLGNSVVQAATFTVNNKCPFTIWPATASNQGHPVIAKGGFSLATGKSSKFQAPGDWSGRIWARTGCNFNSSRRPACETGDCNGQLQCNGNIGTPPATLVEFSLQGNPNFYDVSLVDGYNLPVSVDNKESSRDCHIGSCTRNLKTTCPADLKVANSRGQVVACKSACLAYNQDSYCCRNAYGSPQTCQPSTYSRLFKDACPSYVSYAFDSPSPLVTCDSDDLIITFCPSKWGSEHTST